MPGGRCCWIRKSCADSSPPWASALGAPQQLETQPSVEPRQRGPTPARVTWVRSALLWHSDVLILYPQGLMRNNGAWGLWMCLGQTGPSHPGPNCVLQLHSPLSPHCLPSLFPGLLLEPLFPAKLTSSLWAWAVPPLLFLTSFGTPFPRKWN